MSKDLTFFIAKNLIFSEKTSINLASCYDTHKSIANLATKVSEKLHKVSHSNHN